jgi:hypothetical protein
MGEKIKLWPETKGFLIGSPGWTKALPLHGGTQVALGLLGFGAFGVRGMRYHFTRAVRIGLEPFRSGHCARLVVPLGNRRSCLAQ